jgi:hypothetical protein
MGCLRWLVLVFGILSMGKPCLLWPLIIRLLSNAFMIRRLRLGRVLFLAFIVRGAALVKLLLMLNLSLPFFMTEANYCDGFLKILLIISQAQCL